ncbi:hypothetical protein GMOD_00007417 [Pyrenophora seminiperda CCB06]|uniref:NAD(P)-binding domain-containing protein n=1 Tax=Pyrenophora seminiperda CCB06 TaxID=1302712 RepID=A0A3M7MD17_9PLEO|nr:hypothetical protein GMOD_00007417 [Pyrenophora seminiperda CCB06]
MEKLTMHRHILVLGGTSPTGIDFCLAALRDGHELTLYARNPSKIPPEIADQANVVVGALTDAAKVETAVASGAKTCVSFLGPVQGMTKGCTPVTDGYRVILPLLEKHRYERNLFLSTASYHDPADAFSFTFLTLIWMIWLFAHPAYVEINAMNTEFVNLPDRMKWTVYRVPILRSGEPKPIMAGMIGQTGMFLERKGLAEWLLKEMEEDKWVGKCPAVSNA